MLANILSRVSPRVDYVICINDGSTDESLDILNNFAIKSKKTYIVNQPRNTGMAGALRAGFLFALYLLHQGTLQSEDIVVTIDADGQHKPEYIPEIVAYMKNKKADVVLTHRDFSVYPRYKIWGNKFLTWTNSMLSGLKYNDVESGFRLLRVKTLESILKYYTGVRYFVRQEIALVSARSGFKIDNDYLVEIAYYRPGTTIWDGFIVLFLSLLTYIRWRFDFQSNVIWNTQLMSESFENSRNLWKIRKGK